MRPGALSERHDIRQRNECPNDDARQDPALLRLDDHGDGADDESGSPRELDQRNPFGVASDALREAAEEVPRQRPEGDEQVEAGVAELEASDAVGDERGDLRVGDPAGAAGVQDLTGSSP